MGKGIGPRGLGATKSPAKMYNSPAKLDTPKSGRRAAIEKRQKQADQGRDFDAARSSIYGEEMKKAFKTTGYKGGGPKNPAYVKADKIAREATDRRLGIGGADGDAIRSKYPSLHTNNKRAK